MSAAPQNPIDTDAPLTNFSQCHAGILRHLNDFGQLPELLEPAQRLITDLYEAGVDALIVQDMGIMELDLPPIELHASTQCDIRSVEKAKFLSDAGFSRSCWRAN